MKNKIKKLSLFVVFTLALVIGFNVNKTTVKAATTEYYYLQGGESLSLNVSSINKATLDWPNMNQSYGGVKFGYKKNDSTKYLTLITDSAKTKKIQACNVTGVYTFYINKKGSTDNDNRVKTIVVYMYAKGADNSSISLTNNTSTTNGSKVNQPVYLHKGQTSTLTLSQSSWGPMAIATGSNAQAITTSSYTSSNTNVATISASGNNFIVKAGNTAGNSTIRVTKRWISSNGITYSLYRDINVYVYDKPTFSIYKIDNESEHLCTGNQYFSWQDIAGINHTYKYMYKATYPSGMSLKSVNCTTTDKNALSISTNFPYVTFTPKSHFTNQMITFEFLVDSPVRTHNGDSYSTFKINYSSSFIASNQSYATGIEFANSTATTNLGKLYSQVATITPSNALDKTIHYSVDNTDIATIDRMTGVVTPKAHGKVKVYAECDTNEKLKASYTLTIIPNTPTNVVATSTDEGNKITWNAVEDVNTYGIYRSTSKDGTYSKIGSTSTLFYVDGKADYGTQYYYKIIASYGSYNSEYSYPVSVTRNLNTPNISAVKKVGTGIYQITINGSFYNGFKIYSVSGSGNKNLLVTTNSKYATVSLEVGKSYTLIVRAYKNVNGSTIYSSYSPEMRITINKDSSVTSGNNSGISNSDKQTIINYLTTNNIQYVVKGNKVILKKKPTKFKVKRKGSKKIKVTWKKNKKIKANIQIKYSTSKKFSSSKTHFKLVNASKGKVTLIKLSKNKKYYIKIRYRKYIDGIYVYSPYTKVKTVKTKK